MDQFIESYYVAQITLHATQLTNSFKYFRSNVEREVSAAMTLLSVQSVDEMPNLLSLTQTLTAAKEQFLQGLNENQAKIKLIRATAEKLKAYQGMTQEQRTAVMQKIFLSFLVEYLFKNEMKSTITFIKSFQKVDDNFMDSGLEKYQTFKEIASNLALKKTDQLAEWCRANRSKLKKLKSNLEFRVHARNFYELIQTGQEKDLLPYIQNKITGLTNDPDELFSLLRLLMTDVDAAMPAEFSLQALTSEFCKFYFEIEGFNQNYFLENLIVVSSPDRYKSDENGTLQLQILSQSQLPCVFEVDFAD